ncbi:UNKNOWN [Stylonychia lemnae]|uniref:Transmembrane protein n=1 Tax=Stylonychia lemnae TaxID=5949 RepID=A0A078ACU5_STYLE|nr:UNKNOWN [Stylonychia lemnae]|eukprot:CDW78668.1 UNKNOWN [Stylonychia lemnae]
MSTPSMAERASKYKTLAIYGASASVVALLSYYLYTRYLKSSRSSSTSSDSADESTTIATLQNKNGVVSSSPTKRKQNSNNTHKNGNLPNNLGQNYRNSKTSREKINLPKYACSCVGIQKCKDCEEDGQSDRSIYRNNRDSISNNNGRLKGPLHQNGRKVVFFDSNDEMIPASEASEDDALDRSVRSKYYARVMVCATEEEKKRLREMIYKQKQKKIQQFLNQVNDKKTQSILQNKKKFKEDNIRQIINAEGGPGQKSQGSRTTSTMSDENAKNQNGDASEITRQQDMIKYNNQKSQKTLNHGSQLNQQQPGLVELSPSHFQDKDRNRWFDLFSLYTQNFMNEEEKTGKHKKTQNVTGYHKSSQQNQKKRSASME